MSTEVEDFYIHTATVQTFQGESGYGADVYADPVTRAGFLDGASKLVRDKEGQQVISTATWYTYSTDLDVYALDSLVTCNNIVNRRVIGVAFHDSGALDLPDHLEVNLA